MAKRQFLITAVMQLKGPKNIKSIVDDINKQLAGVKVNVAVNMPQQTITKVQKLSTSLKQVSVAAKKAETDIERFGAQIARSIERYGAFTVATTGFIALIGKITSGISETIKFQRELVRIAQVSGQTLNNLKGLSDEVGRLSKSYGVSSTAILESAVTLSQAGLSAKNVKIALESLAQTGVASTFGNIKDTTEASIAAMQQFGYETKDLGKLLSSINKVSAQFAIESDDITTAIRRAGSAFQAAGGDMNEFLGVVTAVRQTTRESAETISTGLRTIFARLQRPKTQNFLESLGIDVLNDKNQFVGGFEAIKRISEALKQIPSTDVRYARVAEEVAGIRQINKFIPLIEKFDVAEKTLNVSLRSGNSLIEDATKAQEAWAVQIEKVNQQFLELLRTFANNGEVKVVAGVIFNMAESFLRLAKSLETVLPYLTLFAGARIASGLTGITKGFRNEIFKGKGFASGGIVGGVGNRDSEPAFLMPGEYVVKKAAVNKYGKSALDAINRGDFKQFTNGGLIDSRLTNFSRDGADLTSMKQAKQLALSFIDSLGDFGKKFKSKFGELAGLSEYTKYDSKYNDSNTRGLYNPKFNKNYIGNSATQFTVAHEYGHNTDYILGKGSASSNIKGSFQNTITEQLKPLLKSQLDKDNVLSSKDKTYRLKNTEIFADLLANTTKEIREILVSTTDAKLGMKRLNSYLKNNPLETIVPSGSKGTKGPSGPVPPTLPPSPPPPNGPNNPIPPGRNGFGGGFGRFKPNFGGIGDAAGAAANKFQNNGLTNFFILNSITALSDSFLGAESAVSEFSRGLTQTVGQMSLLTTLFKGLSSTAQGIGESSVFGTAFSKAGKVAKDTERKVFREESRKLASIALGNQFGLSGEDFNKASVGDLVSTTKLSKTQQSNAYRNYAIDEALAKAGKTRGGLSYDDFYATKIATDPKLVRALNKEKRSLTTAQKTKALENAQLEIFEGQYGVGATKKDVAKQTLDNLKKDKNYREETKAARAEAREFARQKGEVARVKQRELEGRGAKAVAIADFAAAGIGVAGTYLGSRYSNSANKKLNKGEDARTESAIGSALSAGGTAAGIGLSAGFAIGGPAGAAIGAAALGIPTAIYAFTNGLEEATTVLQNVKFDESFEKIEKDIEKVLTGRLDAGNTVSSTRRFFDETAKTFGSGSVDVRTNIRSNIKGQAENFESLFSKIADTTKTFGDFEKVTGNSLSVFSRISGIPYSELKKKIEDQIKANEKLAKYNTNLADAYQEQTLRLNNLNDLISAVASVSVKQSDIAQGLSRISDVGGSTSQSIGSRLGLFDAAKEGRGDLAGFASVVRNISGNVGGPAASVGKEAIFAAQIAKELPNVLLGLQKGNPLDASGGIIDQLSVELDKIAKKIGYGGNELQRAIINSASEILGTGEDEGKLIQSIDSDLNGTITKLTNGLGTSADVFKELTSLYSTNIDTLKSSFEKYFGILERSSELELKRQDVIFSALKTRNSFFDRDTPLAATFANTQNRLGIISGQKDNTAAGLGRTITRSESNIAQLDEAIKKNFGNKNQVNLEAMRAKEVDNLNRANKALEELATNSDNLGAIQEQIGKEQEKSKLKKETLNTLVFGDRNQQKELAKQLLLTTFAQVNPQGLGAIPQNLRGSVLETLDKNPEGDFNGEKTKDLRKRLIKQAGVEAGVQPNIAEQITSGITPAISELIKKFDEQVKIQNDAITTQINLNNNTSESLKTALVDANKAFLDSLQKIFADNENQRKATRDTEIKTNINVLKDQIGLRNNLSRGVVNGVNIGTKNVANLSGGIQELERYNTLRNNRNDLSFKYSSSNKILEKLSVGKQYSNIPDVLKTINDIETETGFDLSKSREKFSEYDSNRVYDTKTIKQKIQSELDSKYQEKIKTSNEELSKSANSLKELGVNAQALTLPFEKLNEVIKKLQVGLGELNQIQNPVTLEQRLKAEENKLGLASGGRVPGTGNFDSVPAMLTPGEFVLKKSAVEAIGLENLYAMNDIQKFAKGGLAKKQASIDARLAKKQASIASRLAKKQERTDNLRRFIADKKSGKYRPSYIFGKNPNAAPSYNISRNNLGPNGGTAEGNRAISCEQYRKETAYTPTKRGFPKPFRKRLAEGGLVSGESNTSFDMSFISRFDSVLKTFNNSVDRLVNSIQSLGGLSITMSARHDVNVVFNGAETLGRLMPELRDLAVSAAKQEINKMIDAKFPDVGRV